MPHEGQNISSTGFLATQNRQTGIRALSEADLTTILRLALRNCSLSKNSLESLNRREYSGCVRNNSETDSSIPTLSFSISSGFNDGIPRDDHTASLVMKDLTTAMSLTTSRLLRSAVTSDSLCQDKSARRTGTETILIPSNEAENPIPPADYLRDRMIEHVAALHVTQLMS